MSNLPISEHLVPAIEDELAKCHGDLAKACRVLNISLRHLRIWLEREPDAQARIRAAQLDGYSLIESAAISRAVDGVEKAVYYQGEVVGYETVYSDALMNTVLKARVPGYNPDSTVNHNHSVNVQIMPRAANYQEWLEHSRVALEHHDTVDGEYTEIPTPNHTALKDVL